MKFHNTIAALTLLLLIESASCIAAQGTPVETTVSGIEARPPGRTPPHPGWSTCLRLSPYRVSLCDIGLGDVGLEKEVTCIVADFDSNGSLDFLIYGNQEPSKQGLRVTTSFKVLFFDDRRMLRAETIRRDDYDYALLWPAGQGSLGACSVSPRTVDGIILPGEGGGTWYFSYDATLRKLTGEFACDE